jgi:hypothetical protein
MIGNFNSAAESVNPSRAVSVSCARDMLSVAGISSAEMPASRRYNLSRSRLRTSRGGLSSGRGHCGAIESILRNASMHSAESDATVMATSCSGSGEGKSTPSTM